MSPYAPIVILIVLAIIQRTLYVTLLEKVFKVTFKNAPARSFLFFFIWCVLFVVLFPVEVHRLFADISILGYLALIFIVLVIFPSIFRLLHDQAGPPLWLSSLFPTQSMLALEEQYILAKVGDVVSQQIIGGILMLLLYDLGFEYQTIVVFFVILFALSHVYLFVTSGLIWGLHYTVFSAAAGFAIPFFIFFIEGGIAYAIIAHLAFYVLSAAFFAEFPRPSRAVCIDVLHDHTAATRDIHRAKRDRQRVY